jgi:hypothetical protein
VSNKGEIVVIVPGAIGWEFWQGLPPNSFVRKDATNVELASQIHGLPVLDVMMFFPVKSATVMPFRVTSGDESLFDDMVSMHIERMSVKVDPGAGQLVDTSIIQKEQESSVLSTIVLRAPQEGELPLRSPKEFDYSPRAYVHSENGVAVWKEFSYWVFSFYQQGKVLYAQVSSSQAEHPDNDLLREIKLSHAQLGLQGILFFPKVAHVWHPEGELGEAGSLENIFGICVEVCRRPDPVMSVVPSKLLPADVFAERRERAKKRKLIIGICSAAAVIIAFCSWLGWGLFQQISQTKKLTARLEELKPETESLKLHKAKWNELGPIVDQDQWPVETLLRVSKCMPAAGGIRLRKAEITNNEIRIVGESAQTGPIGQLNAAIKSSDELQRFKFVYGSPSTSANGWEFTTVGALPLQTQ